MPARFDDTPLPYTSTKPFPPPPPHDPSPSSSSSGYPNRGPSLKRGKTLTRPERHVAPVPLIAPPPTHFSEGSGLGFSASPGGARDREGRGCWPMWDWWILSSYITTWWAPPALLRLFGIKEKQSRQAWREKITLCWIAVLLGAIVGFATMGLQRALCPAGETNLLYTRFGTGDLTLSISGRVVNISTSLVQPHADFYKISQTMPGQDITNLFQRRLSDYPECSSNLRYSSTPLCASGADPKVKENGTLQGCALPQLSDTTFAALQIQNTDLQEGYSWDQVAALPYYMVLDGLVLNLSPYISANPNPIPGDEVDFAIRRVLYNQSESGKDATMLFHHTTITKDAIPCMQARYLAGRIDKITPGCFVASLFLYVSLTVILGVVLVRFAMACIFNWFMSARLVLPPKDLARNAISPAVMPEGANVSVHNKTGTAPWAAGGAGSPSKKLRSNRTGTYANGNGNGKVPMSMSNGLNSSSTTLVNGVSEPIINLTRIGAELFAVCLVTCYSEDEDSVRGTLESIAATNYSDSRKLMWVVCDGMITGQGEKRSTPDICVSMLDADPRFGNPMPMGYIAVGSGAKRENRAMVYAGHYVSKNGHRTPTIVVVKCGIPSEAKDKKPGNRGKRDSQLILMQFFSRVTYNDRMSPLDFDLFRKVHTLMGVTPDYFEVVLMVDADTKIYPDSLKYLVNCMHADNMIMGVCGETRIANKRQSWVTAIQVYEYFISHHHVKAFESVFGGVTCLPGCFSMYRIKARKDSDTDWVPILVKPEIVREYSQSEVTTLHQKNLLLLGEDRFLSTIMLRAFPRRKNIFLPQAKCRTVAPDTFSVLLSQRRRWINSTIHNLMELVRVRNLCGTFCFSMQFVVFMDLIGTVVLPVAICLTGALIVNSIIKPPTSFQEAIPLMLLAAVLGLPAILILITTRKVIYVAWMICYLLALPIWNFVLPVYSFWHFDDFSWGETRRVEGEIRSKGHDDKTAVFDGTTIPLRRWEDWEKSRLRKLKREERRRKEFERQYGGGFHGYNQASSSEGSYEGGVYGLAPGMAGSRAWVRSEYESDAGSVFSGDEDIWGGEIGGYNEYNPAFPPPPIALPPTSLSASGQTLGMDEMAAILDSGFEESSSSSFPPTNPFRNGNGYGNHTSSPLAHSHAAPMTPTPGMPNTGDSISSSVESRHVKRRSGGVRDTGDRDRDRDRERYGPMGPLSNHEEGDGDWGDGFKGRRI